MKLVCVAVAIGSCLCASTTTAAAKGSKPVISNFKAAPAIVTSAGTVVVTAAVSGAGTCTLSASKPVPGLPAALDCEDGSIEKRLVMPLNAGKKAANYKLKLIAVAFDGPEARATTTLTVAAGSPPTVTAVAAGVAHTCALLSTGHIDCWGGSDLGDGTTQGSDTPVEVAGITNATQVAAGGQHTCALLSTGHVECWGSNEWGQLGNGATTESEAPVEVTGITDAAQVTVGALDACALLAGGNVACWGENGYGELGDSTSTGPETCGEHRYPCSRTPVETTGIANASQVAAGAWHTCALLITGHIECWGYNESEQLGDGTSTGPDYCFSLSCSRTPVEVTGITDGTQVAAGVQDTCALLSTGHIDCWGLNEQGELGSGAEGGWSGTPVEVTGITDATQVGAGWLHTCAVTSGRIKCWGENEYGQLGNGTTTRSDIPVEVLGITSATQAAGGWRYTCAVLASGHIECWGENEYGQLGNGTTTSSNTPVEVTGT